MLSPTAALVVVAGAFTGGFVSGLAGFGTGLIALGFWLHVIDPAPAATLVALCSVASQTQTLPMMWHAMDGRRLWPMLVAGLIGVPIGTFLLSRLNMEVFRLSVGLFLMAFAAFMLLGRAQPRLLWGGRIADSAVAFTGGILGGLAGLSGALPTVWATLRGWSKHERRSVIQAFNLTILAAVAVWHIVSGMMTIQLAWLVVIALPGTFAGAWLGAHAYRRLSDKRFHEVVLCLLAISGLTLVWASF